ncbi:hypothetical protein [Halegenticoccus tardaugens]|uniref:hypothetical protein n=1 Tax=Halegenticoccus tardaugens TaxID=2071624 RepID=UPI00100A6D79|nr:hypothetical protein [Halegenticoccus tardaugens]
MRRPDALDYALVSAVTLLAYLQLPWRPEIRERLRSVAGSIASIEIGFGPGATIVILGIFGAIFLVFMTEALPKRK